MRRTWAPVAISDVPDGIILFDGVCVLCSWWVRFVIERDPAAAFRFVPVQSDYGLVLAGALGIDPADPQTNAVIVAGRAWFKSDAAIRVLAGLPGWSWVLLFQAVPRRLRDWSYDRVARNRYRLFGRLDTCLMPTPDLARRFLTDPPRG